MVDACTVSGPDTTGVLDETTGQYTTASGASRYTGPCRVKVQATQDRATSAGERVIMLRTFIVSLPITAVTVKVDDVVRITASVLDSALVGTRMRVVDVAKGTGLTARRLVAEEVTS